jgi:predicted RNase H-like nuclease (RuvC/YqgF family)
MKEDLKTEELMEAAREARRQLEREKEELMERAEQLKGFMLSLEATEEVLQENERLKSENEAQQKEIDGLNQQLQDKDTQLKELGKLSAGVAKKSSADDVSKAIRIYLNTSKRKTQSKREAAKIVLLELITAAKLEMSEDIMESLSHFDDEELAEQPQSSGTVTENLAELLTAEAQVLWQRLRDAGFIVADGYALAEGISANQAAYIADRMAEKLKIKKKWKLFQQLWGIPNLAQLAGTWQQTGKLPPRSSDIDKLMK